MCGGLLGFPLLPGVCYGMWPGRWIPPPLLVEQSPPYLKGNPSSWGPPPPVMLVKGVFTLRSNNSQICPDSETDCLAWFCLLTFLNGFRFWGVRENLWIPGKTSICCTSEVLKLGVCFALNLGVTGVLSVLRQLNEKVPPNLWRRQGPGLSPLLDGAHGPQGS